MKVMTVVGTRPELIRLSRIIPLLDDNCDHIFVHTGQNYDKNLKDIFFRDLNIRDPDYTQQWVSGGFSDDVHNVLKISEDVIRETKPDKLLILGDTNSGLSSIVAKKYGVKVYHMEAGNRCFDDRVPEEVNRRIIDSCSDILMPYTERSRQNLLHEGYSSNKIYVTGNPINEVLSYYGTEIDRSSILRDLDLLGKNYFLVTMHRSENVDDCYVLNNLITSLQKIDEVFEDYKIVLSMHPHTLNRLKNNNDVFNPMLEILKRRNFIVKEPFGFFDFIKLERNSSCVISDSGTVQEECCILDIPSVTIRNTTERPETIECGSNILVGCKPNNILQGIKSVMSDLESAERPAEYERINVSSTVMKIILGVQ